MGKDILNELDPDMVKEVKEVMESLKGKSEQEILESLVKLAAQKKEIQ